MAPKDTSYYELLDVSPTATASEIRKAYRVKALKYHPDRAGGSEEAKAAFQHLKAVYEVLSDEGRREEYDTNGPAANVHSVDGDDGIDVQAAAAFFASAGARLSAEDVAAYERTYRGGADEVEDLVDLFARFSGNVVKVVDYIPYSDESDLVRFVELYDTKIADGDLDNTPAWRKSRRVLLKKGRGKERDMSAHTGNDEEMKEIEGGDGEGAEGEDDTGAKAKGRKAAGKANEAAKDDMSNLVALIQAKRQRGKAEFDAWAERIEEQSIAEASEKVGKKAKKSNVKVQKKGEKQGRKQRVSTPSKPTGGVGKPTKRGRK